ncbi:MAG: UbiA family prenyltransferase [Planctomycetaceae bacterium]|jgi:4-hydroxybenzoate polyprenyltransferase|nr:UbiA family prenyltransferase [Planctomycetaceae bacterium]MDG2387919.1 UbiA family prenyltransferase [Planctomycetaceae bacterium]
MKRLLPYFQLMRLPALFTALTDTFTGFMMTLGLAPFSDLYLLLLATTGLYLSGMVFNDVFDIKQDTAERPERPIPSGRVPWTHAVILGVILLLGGLGAAAAVSVHCLKLAGLIAVAVISYDAILKKTWLGPLAMGGCRFLNILLAASAGVSIIAPWQNTFQRPHLGLALGIGIYIIGLTFFARTEALEKSRKKTLILGILIANAGLGVLFWLVNVWPGDIAPSNIYFGLGVIALVLNRRWVRAISNPEPRFVQAGVKSGLLSLIVIDALMLYWKTGEPMYSLIVLAALLPAMLLGRLIPMT